MAAGFRFATADFATIPSWSEPNAARVQHQVWGGLGDYSPVETGPFANHQPITIRSLAKTGWRMPAFFDDLYNAVYFIPASVDFGIIAGTVARDVLVWNAHLHAVTLDALVLRDASGVTVAGKARPFLFGALGVETFTFTARDDAEITLDGWADFTFDPVEPHSLKLTGQRAVIAPWSPNWREKVTVIHEFKTDVYTSRSGKEQRRALRQTARKTLEFTATFRDDGARRLLSMLTRYQNTRLLLPEVTRKVHMTQPMGPQLSVAAIDKSPPWLATGLTVILDDDAVQETRRVAGVSDGMVSFTGSSARGWRIGTRIHPAVFGLVANSIASSLKTNTVSEVPIVFNVTPGSELVVPVPPAPTVFNGRELWDLRPTWGEDISLEYARTRESVDFGFGRTVNHDPVPFTTRNYTSTFNGRNAEEVERMEAFFTRQRGQRGEFYMPTWNADIAIGDIAPAGSKTIRVPGSTFRQEYADDTVQRAVAVLVRGVGWLYNRVESIGALSDNAGDDSAITVSDPWPVELRPDNVRMLCWMPVWRFMSDTMTTEWLTGSVAQVQLAMQTLEDLA